MSWKNMTTLEKAMHSKWAGKWLKDMTREELMVALYQMGAKNRQDSERHIHELGMLT